jgi:hypothetical protein
VDPGWSCAAFAVYAARELSHASLVESPAHLAPADLGRALAALGLAGAGAPGVLVVERPVVYPARGRSAKRRTRSPNDVMKVAQSAGAWSGAGAALGLEVVAVEPASWKRQLDKDVVHARLREALSASELAVLDAAVRTVPKKLGHNVLDAAAIGAWALGRLPGFPPRPARLLEF